MMNLLRSEKGTVVIIVAMVMTLLLGMTALVLDIGVIYLEKSRLQKAVDSAVLAGAMDYPSRPDLGQRAAEHVAQGNGVEASDLTLTFDRTDMSLAGGSSKEVLATFSKVLGFSDNTIHATAKIKFGPIGAGVGAIPLGVNAGTPLTFGQQAKLKVGTADTGNFGALALTGSGASNYERDLQQGFDGELSVYDVLNTETGQIANPTKRAIEHRISSCPYPGATYTDYPVNCPRIGLIPVYQPVVTQQNQIKQVRVVGFAFFFIESVSDNNQGAEVVGRFIEKTISGPIVSAGSSYGAYGYKLVE
ncbi:pilus assembly protein TadG-related protein [Ammoniphilus sp. CFH 90114]|uniref:pilus assembly protein TadG-related protein n=1 Tax=Ammoniphilus sp. CFH 90114 TaxID=2493665 RepID=UPI00100DCD04|nr:pilus assembly protein TadG-related protein [Ammoniphilus sp. CFH 90114]RXT13562.1 hypothetical protein EIZ39_05265 [Ammoniphilus sp. CFH 90114]